MTTRPTETTTWSETDRPARFHCLADVGETLCTSKQAKMWYAGKNGDAYCEEHWPIKNGDEEE